MYESGKVYKLVCNKTGKQYVGSTTQKYLSSRKAQHVHGVKSGSRVCSSKEIVEGGDFEIVLLETYPCDSVEELRVRERYWIETIPCVNKVIPCRTAKEWIEDNRETYLSKKKEYYVNNKEACSLRSKQYYQEHKQECSDYKKMYHAKNRDEQIAKMREYREKNKERLKLWYSEKTTCECGAEVSRQNMSRHLKTEKHQHSSKS